MMKNDNLNEKILFDYGYDESAIVIIGIPFDGTACYRPGARFGPQAIRQELYAIESYSPYLDKDLVDYKVYDLGDAEMPIGNTTAAMKCVEQEVVKLLKDDKKTVSMGGEHLVSYPIIQAYKQKYEDLVVVQLDAHADLRESFSCEKLSHASVMKRAYDILGDNRIYQLGIRSGTKEEFDFAKDHTNICRFDLTGLKEMINSIGDKPVYLTIDLDVLDPSIFSGTGTPEPGGITFKELIDGLALLSKSNIVGGDIVELSPHYDTSGVSTMVACKVLRELILLM